ncbi:MAG: FitA-like ribbon-helix-helix domain-containing protein [Myxococcota bacterium]
MSVMIQVRNVSDDMHRRLKARAALAGMTLSDYVREELRRSLERPTRDDLLRRIRSRVPVRVSEAPADAVRAERERR